MVSSSLYKKKILLTDDDESILTMLETILWKEGYLCIKKAGTGEEALRTVESFQPDLIILDIMLPDFDGFEVCRKLRETSMTPVLFLSARSDETDRNSLWLKCLGIFLVTAVAVIFISSWLFSLKITIPLSIAAEDLSALGGDEQTAVISSSRDKIFSDFFQISDAFGKSSLPTENYALNGL